MGLVTRQVPALFNGVSQQPATLRLPSQASEQINGYPTVAEGLRKRPPFEHIARFTTAQLTSAFLHTVNRDVTERYIVVITDGDLKVYDLNGVEQAVNFPLGKAYLSTGGAAAVESFAVVTIGDYSFVVNKTRTVATKTPPTAQPTQYPNWYFPGTWFPGGVAPPAAAYFNPTQGTFRGTRQTFTDLPKTTDQTPPQEGDVWKIAGFDQNGFGAYFVVRRNGVWEETFDPNGGNVTLDELTMPHALVRLGDGTFRFTVFPWNARKVGDGDSNPAPTFVGSQIRDVGYYKNRLFFVSGENVVFSAAGDYGNFFRTTVTDLLDSDPVDIAVSTTKASELQFAVPFNNGLMLFADQTQFRLNVEGNLTPSSVSIDTATEFEASKRCRPVGIGSVAYFVTESGNHSRVREYFVDQDTLVNDAADITAHVPRYVPRGVIKLAGNANEDVLFALSDQQRRRLYVYKFFWGGDSKIQSAWSYWEFPATDSVLSVETLENQVVAVVQRADGAYIERANIQSGAVTGTLDRQVLLDRLASVTGVWNSGTGRTEFTLPYPVDVANRPGYRIVRGGGYGGLSQALVDPSQYQWISSTRVDVLGNHAGQCWAGQSYTFRYTFSEQFVMNGDQPVTTGRLMMRTFVLYFTDAAYFKTEVAPYGTDPLVETVIPPQLSEFTGKTVGDAALRLNTPTYASGKYAFQVYGDSRVATVSLVNDAHVQSVFNSAEWEGLYFNRARPL